MTSSLPLFVNDPYKVFCVCSYGDIFPISGLGKFVGTFTAISGALTMSLPLPIIVSNFEK